MTDNNQEPDSIEQELMNELESVLSDPVTEPINARYELIIDMGKPYSDYHTTIDSVKQALTEIYFDYLENADTMPHLDLTLLDNGVNITESQEIQEIINEIMEAGERARNSEIEPEAITEPEALTEFEKTGVPFPMPSSYGLGSEPQDNPLEFSGHIDPKLIKAFFQGIDCTVDEVKIYITKSGWHVMTVDPAHVCMSDMTLNKCAFADYKAIGEGSIGIDVDKVLEVIKAAKKGDSIGISITEDKIIMSAGIIVREIKPIDTSGFCDPKVPNLNLPDTFTINQEYLVTALEQCGNVSDHVAIEGDIQGNLKIYSSGDTDGVKATIPKDLMDNVRMTESFKSLFPLDYLQTIAKASQFGMLLKGQELNVCMGNDYPIKIMAETKDWGITYLLAPRIESE